MMTFQNKETYVWHLWGVDSPTFRFHVIHIESKWLGFYLPQMVEYAICSSYLNWEDPHMLAFCFIFREHKVDFPLLVEFPLFFEAWILSLLFFFLAKW